MTQETWKEAVVRKNKKGEVYFLKLKGVLVSDQGRMMRKSTGNIIKTYDANQSPSLAERFPMNNYAKARLMTTEGYATNVKVHNVVLSTFNPCDSTEHEIDHIDGNRKNNALSNLQWLTHAENMRKARNSKQAC